MISEVFKAELGKLLNSHSIDNCAGIPDFMLVEHVTRCLENLAATTRERDRWLKRSSYPGKDLVNVSYPMANNPETDVSHYDLLSLGIDSQALVDEADRLGIKAESIMGGKRINMDGLTQVGSK
jgi:hypothetical protein